MSALFSKPKISAPPPTPTASTAEVAQSRVDQRRRAANRRGREDTLLGGSTGGSVSTNRLLGQ